MNYEHDEQHTESGRWWARLDESGRGTGTSFDLRRGGRRGGTEIHASYETGKRDAVERDDRRIEFRCRRWCRCAFAEFDAAP